MSSASSIREYEIIKKIDNEKYIVCDKETKELKCVTSEIKLEGVEMYKFYNVKDLDEMTVNYKLSPKKLGLSKSKIPKKNVTSFKDKLLSS